MEADLIKNLSRHIQLNEEEQKLLLSRMQLRRLKRKEFLFRAGEFCRYESFVIKGCLRTYFIDEKGAEHIVMFAPEDWWTGDLHSFLTDTPSNFYIDALEDTELLQVSRSELEKLYLEIPKLERFFRIMLQNAFIAQQQRIAGTLAMTAEERYQNFISKYPQLEQRISQKHIASFLGITPEFLSMLRAKLARGIS